MVETATFLAAAYLAYVLGTASPGPNILAIVDASITEGRAASIPLALGIAGGSLMWGVASVTGLTLLLVRVPAAIGVLQAAGASYLFYLAWKAWRSARGPDPQSAPLDRRAGAARRFAQGLAIQATNPKSAITWLVVYTVALTESASAALAGAVIAGNVALSVIIHTVYATLLSHDRVRRAFLARRRAMQGAIAVLFCGLAVALLTTRSLGGAV
jgi:threonine/homoserine/homoserine lactone efflux protein